MADLLQINAAFFDWSCVGNGLTHRGCILVLTEKLDDKDVEDVVANMLSIEEQRAKIEQDEINRLALEKKDKVRAKVEDIRKTLADLFKENKARERSQQLQAVDFEVDPLIRG